MVPQEITTKKDGNSRFPVQQVTPERSSDNPTRNVRRNQVLNNSQVPPGSFGLLSVPQNKYEIYCPSGPTAEKERGSLKRQQQRSHKPSDEKFELAALLEKIEQETEPSRKAYSCGTLKLLSAKPAYHEMFATSLEKVLSICTLVLREVRDALVYGNVINKFALESYFSMRSRILSLLTTLALEPMHRPRIFNSTGLTYELVEIIKNDEQMDREKALTCFSYFSKHAANRETILRIEGMTGIFTDILDPNAQNKETLVQQQSSKEDSSISTQLDAFRHIAVDGETSRYISSNDDATFAGKNHFIDRSTALTKNIMPEDDFTQEESPPRKKYNSKYEARISFNSVSSDEELEAQDIELTAVTKRHPYDSPVDKYLGSSRIHVLAILVHLSKEKQNAKRLASDDKLISVLVEISTAFDSLAHLWCLVILANLTRLPSNIHLLVSRHDSLLPSLTEALGSKQNETKRFAAFAIQNLSTNSVVRKEMADSCVLVKVLCSSILSDDTSASNGESLASIAALKNMVDDASNIFKLLNSPLFLKNLTVIALRAEAFVTDEMQFIACDALATFSYWLDRVTSSPLLKDERFVNVTLPTHKDVAWDSWEE